MNKRDPQDASFDFQKCSDMYKIGIDKKAWFWRLPLLMMYPSALNLLQMNITKQIGL